MGYMRLHAIIVSGSYGDALDRAHGEAKRLFGHPAQPWETGPLAPVTEITPASTNGYRSFMVAPDGSKEGWSHSDAGDVARAGFVGYLRGLAYDDGSGPLDWVEVQYGDDEGRTLVCRHSDDDGDRDPVDLTSRRKTG